MASRRSPLRSLKIASPCPANWDEMYGTDRVRFCGECRLNVYNLSEMTRVEAERLIASTEGRLCVRYYERRDGTVLTQDCPVGLAAFRRRAARLAGALAGFFLGIVGGGGAVLSLQGGAPPIGHERTMGTIAVPPPKPNVIQGDVRPMTGVIAIEAPPPNPPVEQGRVVRRR